MTEHETTNDKSGDGGAAELDAATILAIREAVDAWIGRYAKIIGIPTVVFVLGVVVYSFFTFQGKAVEAAESKADRTIKKWREDVKLDDLLKRIDVVKAQIEQEAGRLRDVRKEMSTLSDLVSEKNKEITQSLAALDKRRIELSAIIDGMQRTQQELASVQKRLQKGSDELGGKLTAVDERRQEIADRLEEVDRDVGTQREAAAQLEVQLASMGEATTWISERTRRARDSVLAIQASIHGMQEAEKELRDLLAGVQERVKDANFDKVNAVLKEVEEHKGAASILHGFKQHTEELAKLTTRVGELAGFDTQLRNGSVRLEQVRAGQLKVETPKGVAICELAAGKNADGTLWLRNSEGNLRVNLGTSVQGGGGMWLTSDDGKEAVKLASTRDYGLLILMRQGINMAELFPHAAGGCYLKLYDGRGIQRVIAGTAVAGNGNVWLVDTAGNKLPIR